MKISSKLIAAAAGLLLCFAGCAQKSALSFKAGTYRAEAQGNGGPVPVSVTFTNTALKSIVVEANKETPGIADPAIQKIPEAIVKGQTLAVDTISGCTVTCNAIIAAVTDCVVQAGGDVAAMQVKKIAKAKAGKPIERNVDVVVIGGGGAGLAAAGSGKDDAEVRVEGVDWARYLGDASLNPYVRHAMERIRADYREKLSIEVLAEEAGVSASYLSRKFKEAAGQTFLELLTRERLQNAIVQLASGKYRVYEVAEENGFGDYKNFCSVFKKYMKCSPREFLQQPK